MVVIDKNTTIRIPTTMVIVDKDDLIVDDVDGLAVDGTTVGAKVEGSTVGAKVEGSTVGTAVNGIIVGSTVGAAVEGL